MLINIPARMHCGVPLLLIALFVTVNSSVLLAHPPAASAPGGASPRHRGQVSTTTSYAFEVVFQRNETRVYLYDRSLRPASARGLRGEVVMRVRGNSNLYRYPLEYTAVDARSGEQDYLVARVDVSKIRDGDMQVTFDLAGLPARGEPAARFTQTFALTQAAPVVTVSAVTRDDSAAIARQGKCVVMDTKLGDHGRPIKLLVGKQAIYVCCKGCINKVKKNPSLYFGR